MYKSAGGWIKGSATRVQRGRESGMPRFHLQFCGRRGYDAQLQLRLRGQNLARFRGRAAGVVMPRKCESSSNPPTRASPPSLPLPPLFAPPFPLDSISSDKYRGVFDGVNDASQRDIGISPGKGREGRGGGGLIGSPETFHGFERERERENIAGPN